METNNSGSVTSSLTYSPFGQTETETGIKVNDYTYTDQYFDSETALLYMNARYYDPELKRFTSVDPPSVELNKETQEARLSNSQDLGVYTYAMNNPLKYIDPTGNSNETSIY